MIFFQLIWKSIYPNLTHLFEPSESAQNIMNFIPGRESGGRSTPTSTQICGNVIKVIRRRRRLSVSVARAIMGEQGQNAGRRGEDGSEEGESPKWLPPWRGKRQVAGARGCPGAQRTTRTNISDIIYHQPACHSTYSPTPGWKKCTTTACKGLWWVACLWLCVGALSLGVLSKNYYAY